MLECMKNRRSIRKYTDQDIPESLLNELLEVATRASNTGNMQLYSVVVTRDPANKEKLAPAHFNQPMITGADPFGNRCEHRRQETAQMPGTVPIQDHYFCFRSHSMRARSAGDLCFHRLCDHIHRSGYSRIFCSRRRT